MRFNQLYARFKWHSSKFWLLKYFWLLSVYTVKIQKFSTTIDFTHFIRGNYCRKNLLELKNNIEVYKYLKIG